MEDSNCRFSDYLVGWDYFPTFKGIITHSGMNYNKGTYKAIPIKEGDTIIIKAGTYGAYAALVTNLPIFPNTRIPYVDGQVRIVVSSNQTNTINIPSSAKYILIENDREDEGNTCPISILLNNYELLNISPFDLLSCIHNQINYGILTTFYTKKIIISKEKVIIPSQSRILYSDKVYYETPEDIELQRDISATVEFIVFDIKNKVFKNLSYGNYNISDRNLLFCFYIYYNTNGCSLNSSLIKYEDKERFSNYNSIIVPPNNTKIEVLDTQIKIPIFTRLFYENKVYRVLEETIINRVATSSSSFSEEVLVFDKSDNSFKCLGGGNYSSEDENNSNYILICGLKKGSLGTTLSPQISSSLYYLELCVNFNKKINITDETITIPANSRIYYNHNNYYNISQDIIITREIGAQHTFIIFDYITKEIYGATALQFPNRNLSAGILFWVSYTNTCSLSSSLYLINGLSPQEQNNDILKINSKPEVETKLIPQTQNKIDSLLTLLHFSDLHSSTTTLERILEFKNYYNNYIKDIIHTGDTVSGIITDPNPFETVPGAQNILNVLGNHEAWLSYDIPDYTATEKQCYDKIFAPSIANWGVVQPLNASSEGYCYYYKDYNECNIRLIVLDSVHWHFRNSITDDASVQKNWFQNTLNDAKDKNLTVIAALHYNPQNGIDLLKNTGFSRYSENDTDWGDGWYASDEIFSCVDDFINNGGKFSTWIAGHTHYDMCGQIHGHEGQFIIVIQSCSRSGSEDYLVSGTKTQDAFNILTIDPILNLIKITRIGNNMDKYMQSKKTLCYDYKIKKLIYNT